MKRILRNTLCLLFITPVCLILTSCQYDENAGHVPIKQGAVPSAKNNITAINPRSYDKALAYFQQLAKAGDPVAQTNLGRIYDDGRGVKVNHEEAVKWFLKAAAQNYAEGEVHLGVAMLYGRGIAKDTKQACQWFKRAKQQGNRAGTEFYQTNCA